jgi:pimeloyl-ACP methyl ester carboxylesterase
MTETRTVDIYGWPIAYKDSGGDGEVVLLIHGVGSSSTTWDTTTSRIPKPWRTIAVDLPGHGASLAKRGDYSLGAMASVLRDLLDELDVKTVHLVGHSLGGGISLQFVYQYPERVKSLTLVSSGGLGVETASHLKAATLPGSETVMKLGINKATVNTWNWVGRTLDIVHVSPAFLGKDAVESARPLTDRKHRKAFLATLKSVVGPNGQRVSALDKLRMLNGKRVLIVWGEKDRVLPMQHGKTAHELLEGSRLSVYPQANHEPHVQDPVRFARELLEHLLRNMSVQPT